MKEKVLSRMNKIVAVMLLLFGIGALWTSVHDLKFGTFAKPQGGFAPVIFSAGLILFSAVNVGIELFKENRIPKKLEGVDWKKWVCYTALCGVYVGLVEKIGFALDTFVCLLIMLKLTGQKGIVKPLVIAGIFSVVVWGIFTYAMHVPLPGADWF